MKGLMWSAALGATAMYFFDPQSGNRRRALLRDQLIHLRTETSKTMDSIDGRMEDLRNRTKGLIHETRSSMETIAGTRSNTSMDTGTNTMQSGHTEKIAV